jgi:hypothetical protein
MGENLKTSFQASFHPKSEEMVLNVRTGLRTESPSENCPTLVLLAFSFFSPLFGALFY